MITLLLLLFVVFPIYTGLGFCAYFFFSKLTQQPLEWQQALKAALLLGIVVISTSFLGFYSLILVLLVQTMMLVRCYDCGIISSILMTVGALFFPSILAAGIRALAGG